MRFAHIGWNLAGLSLPLVVAATTVPRLISILGQERFGLLALAWGLVGYASALDLGIGRALTQRVSRLRGSGDFASIPTNIVTAGRITFVAGLFGALLIALAAFTGLATHINTVEVPLGEIQLSMLLLAVALPIQAMSATYRGVNEAFLNFKGISLLRIALGVINFGGPFVVAHYTRALPWLVSTLIVSRAVALFIFYRLANACIERPGEAGSACYSSSVARSLFSFGGWITVSSVISPVLVQADRFLIGSVLSATAVTAYVLPYEIVVQSLTLVGAISSVIFPVMSRMLVEQPDACETYFRRWLGRVAGLMLLVCGVIALTLPVVLPAWLGRSLQPVSIQVGQILCIGVFANALGTMFYALVHAKGRADLTAKLHIFELPCFIAALVIMLHYFGIAGAAWAWAGRMVFDAAVLAWLARGRRGADALQRSVTKSICAGEQ